MDDEHDDDEDDAEDTPDELAVPSDSSSLPLSSLDSLADINEWTDDAGDSRLRCMADEADVVSARETADREREEDDERRLLCDVSLHSPPIAGGEDEDGGDGSGREEGRVNWTAE